MEAKPSIGATLITAAKFLAFGFGPAVERSWNVAIIVVNAFLLITTIVGAIEVLHNKGLNRLRAVGALLFLGNVIFIALAVGWARAGSVLELRWFPAQYVIISVPALCIAYFIWILSESSRIRSIAQFGLFLGMVISLPYNVMIGTAWRN